jgi:hypothetical protein
MAGKRTNGSQFFITEVTMFLNDRRTIFRSVRRSGGRKGNRACRRRSVPSNR